MAKCKVLAMVHTAQLILHVVKLGFVIKWEKSSPLTTATGGTSGGCAQCTQPVNHSVKHIQMPRQQAVYKLQLGETVTALTFMQVLTSIAAAHPLLLMGLLHMQYLQRWSASLCQDA